MEIQNNTVGRLHQVLEAALKGNPNSPLRVVWAQALGCEPDNAAELLRLYSELIRLTHSAKHDLSQLDDLDEQLYLAPFKKVEAMLGKISFDLRWHEVKGHLDATTMLGLKYGADRLKREGGATAHLNNGQVATFISDLEKLLADVLASDLPDKLRLLFVKNLEQLRQALIGLRLSGAEGIEQEIDRALGSLFRHGPELTAAAEANPDNSKIITDYFGLISKFNDAVTFGQNLIVIGGPLVSQFTRIVSA